MWCYPSHRHWTLFKYGLRRSPGLTSTDMASVAALRRVVCMPGLPEARVSTEDGPPPPYQSDLSKVLRETPPSSPPTRPPRIHAANGTSRLSAPIKRALRIKPKIIRTAPIADPELPIHREVLPPAHAIDVNRMSFYLPIFPRVKPADSPVPTRSRPRPAIRGKNLGAFFCLLSNSPG